MMRLDRIIASTLFILLSSWWVSMQAAKPSPQSQPNWYAPRGYFASLDSSLQHAKATGQVVSVIQLGDSHIQAGYTTRPLRRSLQQRYGDAGRGWIGWYRLYGSNAPKDYSVTSLGLPWNGETVLRAELTRPIGLGGYSLSTKPGASFGLTVASSATSFSRLLLLRTASSYPLEAREQRSILLGTFALGSYVLDTLSFAHPLSSVNLSPRLEEGDEAVYAGCALLTGQGGVLVSDIGINGAAYRHYIAADYVEQLGQIAPQLLILSLGTNDTYSPRANVAEALEQARSFVRLVKETLPGTKILLTTPPPSFFRSRSSHYLKTGKRRRHRRRVTTTVYSFNIKARDFAAGLMQLAEVERVAAFDLYSAMGGEQGIATWISDKLLLGDRVHYSAEGYERQGQLLSEALLAQLDTKD